MCNQQRLRPACAYAQSDQSLYKSLDYSMNIKLLTEHHLEFLSLTGGCSGLSESTLVKMPHCWKPLVSRLIFRGSNSLTYLFQNLNEFILRSEEVFSLFPTIHCNCSLVSQLLMHLCSLYSKTCLKWPLQNRHNNSLKAMW